MKNFQYSTGLKVILFQGVAQAFSKALSMNFIPNESPSKMGFIYVKQLDSLRIFSVKISKVLEICTSYRQQNIVLRITY